MGSFLKATNPLLCPKPSSCSRATFPPQAQSLDKGHGRIEERKLWATPVDGATVGLAGAAQIFRIDRKVDLCRKGRVIKTTLLAFYGVTSLWTDEANPQREDHCLVRNPVAARNLSLMRSTAIFLYEHQRPKRDAKKSLPDWQRKNIRNPNALIQQLVHPNT